MVTQYLDPNTVHTPATGLVIPAIWGTTVRQCLEALIDPAVCSVFNGSAQSVANNTATALAAGSENFDNDACHSTVTNTSRITIQTAGRYLFLCTTLFASDVDGFRSAKFRTDGATTFADVQIPTLTTGNSVGLVTVGTATLTAGQYVECVVQHTAGAALDVTLREFAAVFLTR